VEIFDKLKLNFKNIEKGLQGNRGTNISMFNFDFPIVETKVHHAVFSHCHLTKPFHVCIGGNSNLSGRSYTES
jgi:hypothetical protein